jgi:hypothetical protein
MAHIESADGFAHLPAVLLACLRLKSVSSALQFQGDRCVTASIFLKGRCTALNLFAGKTTFLNALAGRAPYGVQQGDIRYNGEVHAPSKVKALFGFVPQDDIVHEDLTVEENIITAHALRVGFREAREGRNIVYEVRPLPPLLTCKPRDSDFSPKQAVATSIRCSRPMRI